MSRLPNFGHAKVTQNFPFSDFGTRQCCSQKCPQVCADAIHAHSFPQKNVFMWKIEVFQARVMSWFTCFPWVTWSHIPEV